MVRKSSFILWFSEVDKDDVDLVGGKGANLGEMVKAQFPVPNGFIISSRAYFQFLKQHNLTNKINNLLSTVDYNRSDSLMQVSHHIKNLIMHSEISEQLVKEIFDSYRQLGGLFKNAVVAVRSSSTTEDLSKASFAGQQETFLNVHGEANLLLKVKETWASLFEARLLFYRHEQQYDHFRRGMAVIVQKMINSEKSGVMFTLDPVTNDKSKIIIEAIYGLGDLIAQGQITPDHYEVRKSDLTITNATVVKQEIMMEKYDGKSKIINVPAKEATEQKITNNQILQLAVWAKKLENHYYFPQDIEWAIEKNKIYIVQTRAITTTHMCVCLPGEGCTVTSSKGLPFVLKGAPASPGIASGPVKIINSAKDIGKILPGDVLVVPQTNPDFVGTMKKAAAIITDKGGRTCHAAIICRELGIPAVIGTEKATQLLTPGLVVTVNGTTGEVYKGSNLSFHTTQTEEIRHNQLKTATKVYINLRKTTQIDEAAKENIDGIGSLDAEHMLAEIGIHPRHLIKIGKQKLFVEKLAEELRNVAKKVQPHPVLYQASNFLSHDYRKLKHGEDFEPTEKNPLLGYRGAYRFIHEPELFNLELEAVRNVRQKGITNISLTLPFVRTIRELNEVKHLIKASGLHRSPTFKLWLGIDVPANVILLEKFIENGIDGVVINVDTLATFILGLDKDNSHVAKSFDEFNPAVLWALEHTIQTANKHYIPTILSAHALSVSPALLDKIVMWGVSGISISPEAVDSMRYHLHAVEKKIIESKFHKKNK